MRIFRGNARFGGTREWGRARLLLLGLFNSLAKQLPAAPDPAGESLRADAGAATDRPANPSADRHRVLVVDDDPVNLMVAVELLAGCGVMPLVASDGEQAVALATEERPDLILMDLQMPVLDGLSATRRIRLVEQQRSWSRVPVVAYTSTAASDAVLADSGLDGLLRKPCDLQALRECLSRWCPGPAVPLMAVSSVLIPGA